MTEVQSTPLRPRAGECFPLPVRFGGWCSSAHSLDGLVCLHNLSDDTGVIDGSEARKEKKNALVAEKW